MFNNQSEKISIAIAGSTERTVICAQALLDDPRFNISWIVTPSPREIGRKKIITVNPLHAWAKHNSVKTITLDKKIDDSVKRQILDSENIDFMLVVDFGYLVPKWLLDLPTKAPLNVHPSLLPRWRGSSPGQFVLLHGEKESAVTLMIMDEALDEGPIITQLPFTVSNNWPQQEYYKYSFELIQAKLADLIADFAQDKLIAVPQPLMSPTPIARRLTREDGFIEWNLIEDLMSGKTKSESEYKLNSLLSEASSAHSTLSSLITHACRALSPWPGLWTIVSTNNGQLRLKILSCHVDTASNKLILDSVQLEGKQSSAWQTIEKTLK